MNQTKKKIKLNKVREIIASRLRDDLRQPTLLRSAIQQGKKERESGIPVFTQRVNKENSEPEMKKLTGNSTPIKDPKQAMKNFIKPVSISKMIGK
ncbi:MAG: hypothetical protein HRT47_09580 [Candidatus Caenarcaniphilales bacterium]|nr:hypothetical protein [Candidatus Caenarcaniphilales bacterium]